MKIYEYELKNGAFIHCENIDCIEFGCKHKEIRIWSDKFYMCIYCNMHILDGKCFLVSLYELNENQLIKVVSELERYYKTIFDDSFKS